MSGAFLGLVGVSGLGLLLLPRLVDVNQFRLPLEQSLSTTLGRRVTLGKLRLDTFGSIRLQAEPVRIFERRGGGLESEARRVEAEVELWPLLTRRLAIRRVRLEGLVLRLKRDRAGRWNLDDLAVSPSTVKIDTGYRGPAVSLVDSTVQLTDLGAPTRPPLVIEQVRLDLDPVDPYHLQLDLRGALPGSTFALAGNLVLPKDDPGAAWGGALHIKGEHLAAEPVVAYLGGALEGLKGLIDLDLELQLAREPVVAGMVRARSLDWYWPEAWGKSAWKTSEVRLDASVTFKERQILVKPLKLALPGLQAEIEGTLPRFFNKPARLAVAIKTQPFDPFKVRAQLPGGVLPVPLRTWFDSSTGAGQVSTQLQITGTSERPLVSGQIALAGLDLRNRDFPRPLEKLQGTVAFDADRLVTDLKGNLDRSPFTLAGTIAGYRTAPRPQLTFNSDALDLVVFRWLRTAGLLGDDAALKAITNLSGTARVALQIKSAQTLGLVAFQGANVGLAGQPRPIEAVYGTVRLEPGRTRFEQLKGRFADSPFDLDGELDRGGNLQVRGKGELHFPQILGSTTAALQIRGIAPLEFTAAGSTRKLALRGQLALSRLEMLKVNNLDLLPAQNLALQGTYTPGQLVLASTRLVLGAFTFEGGGTIRQLGSTAEQLDLRLHASRPLTIQTVQKLVPEVAKSGVTGGSTGLELALKGPARAPGFQALLTLQKVALPHLLGGVSELSGPLTVAGDRATTSGLSFQTPDGRGQLKGSLVNFTKPRVSFEANFARLNLDRVLAVPAGTATGSGNTALEARGRLTVARGTIAHLPFEQLQSLVALGGSQFALDSLSLSTAGGRVSGNLKTDSTTHATQGNLTLRGADANTLASQLLKFPPGQISGSTNLDLSFAGRGNGDAFIRSLNGQGALTVSNGRLASLNLMGPILRVAQDAGQSSGFTLNTLLGAVGRLNTGRFQRLGGNFTIKSGTANSENFDYLGSGLRMRVIGSLGLAGREADLQVNGEFTGAPSGNAGLLGNLLTRLLNVPQAQPQAFSFAVRGPINQLSSLRSVRY